MNIRTLFCILLEVFIMSCSNATNSTLQSNKNIEIQNDSLENIKLKNKAGEALIFCKQKKYATNFCLLINLNKSSGKKRFYIWDFINQKAIDSGLVSHGCAHYPWGNSISKDSAITSNEMESHCSSLGKYKVGKRGVSEWGIKIKYQLTGLDKTNNNAEKRFIVLHSWEAVSDDEIYPNGTPEGWGCPAVSNKFMLTLDAKLKTQKLPVLLWIFQ